MAAYKTIPVDPETHEKIMALCAAKDMGKRAQGALVRQLVNAAHEKLEKEIREAAGREQAAKQD